VDDPKIRHARELAHKTLADAGVAADKYRCTVHYSPGRGYMGVILPPSWGSSEDSLPISIKAAITILECCKYAEKHADDVERYSAATACIQQNQTAIKMPTALQARRGRQASGKQKDWYSNDLNLLIEVLLNQGLSAKAIYKQLPNEDPLGEISSIEIDEDGAEYLTIDAIVDDDDKAIHAAGRLTIAAIKKRITVINKSRKETQEKT